jgi:protein SCO1/2
MPMSEVRRRLPKAVLVAIAALAALAVLVAIAVVPRILQSDHGEPVVGGPFTLVDQTGRTVTDADFRGRLMLIFFGYTFCPDVCPMTLSTMADAYGQLTPDQQAQVAMLFITVDPERDTADQMTQYVENFSPAMHGLTGSPEQIAKALRAFRVYARKVDGPDGNYTMDHSAILYLMGKNGKFLSIFPGNATAAEIVDGIRKHLVK